MNTPSGEGALFVFELLQKLVPGRHEGLRSLLLQGRGKGVDIDAATRRLMTALDALESAVERRREADRDENELAARIQALGADRSRLADELDGSLVKTRRLERTNREISDRLDSAIVTIRSVLDTGEDG